MDARVGGGFQAMANYGASLILASSSQTLGARFGNGTHGRAQALALAPVFHHSFKIDFFVTARGRDLRVHRERSPWFATRDEAQEWFDQNFDDIWDEVHAEYPELSCSWRLRSRRRSLPTHESSTESHSDLRATAGE